MNGTRQPAAQPWLQPAQFAVAFALLFLLPQVLLAVAAEAGWWQPQSSTAVKTGFGMGAFAVGGLAVAWLGWRTPPVDGFGRPCAVAVLRAYLPFAAVWLLAVVGYLRLLHACGHAVEPQQQLRLLAELGLARPASWLLVLGIAVVAPVGEELVFRGYLLGSLRLVCGWRLAQLVTAAAFGLLHGLDYALPIAVLGLFFGWLRQRHGGLWPSILAHAVHNAITVVVAVTWPGVLDLLYPR